MFSGLTFWVVLGLLPLLIPLVFFGITFIVSLLDQAGTNPLSETATLNCYHCGQETASTAKTCRHCGGELQ